MTDTATRRVRELDVPEALRLLATAPYGRIAFTLHALPAIRAVPHVLHDGEIALRERGPELAAAVGQIVAFEAGALGPGQRPGWSVSVTGKALRVRDRATAERLGALLPLRPATGPEEFIRISPTLVTGFAVEAG